METLQITRKEIEKNYITNNAELAQLFGLDYQETTIGANGYPSGLNWAITSDSIQKLINLKEQLQKEGYEVEELELHARDGWNLWNRRNAYLRTGIYTQQNDSDYAMMLDMSNEVAELKKEIFNTFYGNIENIDFIEEFNELELMVKSVNDFYEEIQHEEGKSTIFYSPNAPYSYGIDYIVSDDTAGYSYDTHSYQLAIRVVDLEEKEEE